MRKISLTTIIVFAAVALCIYAAVRAEKPARPTRPEPLEYRVYHSPDDFELTSDQPVSLVGTKFSGVLFFRPDGEEFLRDGTLTFVPKLNGVVFAKDAGTEICCTISGRAPIVICASEEFNGLDAASWGLGVSPSPRIEACTITGNATLLSFH